MRRKAWETQKELPDDILALQHYYFDAEQSAQKEIAIITGGFERCTPNFEFKRKALPYHIIECVTKGKLKVEVNGTTYILEPGWVGGIPPGEHYYHYKGLGDSPIEHYYIIFAGTNAKKLFEQSTLAHKGAVSPPNKSESFNLIETIFKRAIEKDTFSHKICCCYLKALLLELAVSLSDINGSYSPSMETYQTCKKYIDNHFSDPISIPKISAACSINAKYMSRLFKKYAGISTSEYIMRLKLNKASALLLTTNLSVKQISYSVGFDDPYHFSKNFKKLYGNSPMHYKKKHQQIVTNL